MRYDKFELIKAGFEDFDKISEIAKISDIDIFYYLSWCGYGKATNDYVIQIQNIKPICDAVNEASKMGCERFLFSTSFSEYMISEHETTIMMVLIAMCMVLRSELHVLWLMQRQHRRVFHSFVSHLLIL